MALGKKFQGLKTNLANYVIEGKKIDRRDVERYLESKGDLTTHTYGDDYANLITIIVEGHMAFHDNLYIPCNRNEYAKNAKMSDVANVVTPALVPNRHFGRCNAVTALPTKGNAVTAIRMNRANALLPEKVNHTVTTRKTEFATSKTHSFCNPGSASQNGGNAVPVFPMSKEKGASAVTASRAAFQMKRANDSLPEKVNLTVTTRKTKFATSKTHSFCYSGTASQNGGNAVPVFPMSKEKRANAVTASRGKYCCRPVTVVEKGGSAVTKFDCRVSVA